MFDNFIFLSSAALAIGGALSVVVSTNLMHSCIYLLMSLIGVSGLYVTLSADFLAATQLVVYVGGVVILMLFAIMLTAGSDNKTVNRFGIVKIPPMGNLKTYIMSLLTAGVMGCSVLKMIMNINQTTKLGELPPYSTTVEQIGTLLVTDHVLAFEISSVLLLGALVGAAVIARPRLENEVTK
ncbi:MAG: NADH-quinone oxidoreductase subunit J [Bacteriovoracaceae bacterium]|jgi:NADH-quinone oxidoreductase subunit J|nr:NADH-quinone oxidoreductase subunit J [Bacteriovoracaceae bacterium]